MRAPILAVWAGLLGKAVAAGCSSNNCLRAVQKVASPSRNGTADCLSFFQVTVTPSTYTSLSTTISSSTTTNNVTLTRNATATITAEPEQRWLAANDALDLLMGIAPLEARQVTVTATAMPSYASPCSNLAAYSSACSCLGFNLTTTTASQPTTTRIITVTSISVTNSTSTLWHNSTVTVPPSTTESTPLSNVLIVSDGETDTGTGTLTTDAGTSSSETGSTGTSNTSPLEASFSIVSATNSTGGVLFANHTGLAETSDESSMPTLTATNSSDPILFANFTGTSDATSFPTATATNSSGSVLFANFTGSADATATTTGPFWNSTCGGVMSSGTCVPFANMTTSSRRFNTTRAPYLNSTCTGRFLNSSACLNTSSTSTFTVDRTCGETSTPFALQVEQPGGVLDGWFVKVSGNGMLFTSQSNLSSQFSIESSGHMCAIGKNGSQGNAAIAIINTIDPTGSPLWLVDANLTTGVIPRGYGDLQCEADGSLNCHNGTVSNWVNCGLQLELTSESGGVVELDERNCTAMSLAVLFGAGNGTGPGTGSGTGNGTSETGAESGTAVVSTETAVATGTAAAPATEPSSGAETGPGSQQNRQAPEGTAVTGAATEAVVPTAVT